jgi:hypothetical protein
MSGARSGVAKTPQMVSSEGNNIPAKRIGAAPSVTALATGPQPQKTLSSIGRHNSGRTERMTGRVLVLEKTWIQFQFTELVKLP